MTRRKRLEAVINGNITEELINDCKKELNKLNERSAAALEKSKESARYKENKELEEQIYAVLSSEPLQVEEIKNALGVEITRQRLTGICTNLVKGGRAESVDVKVKGKGKRKAYIRL